MIKINNYLVKRSLVDKELKTEAESKLNRKGTGWKTDGTSWSMDGGDVSSGAEHTVISGTRVTPNRSFARVLASSARLGLTCCGEVTPAVV
jgi:hypothetical protein